MRRLEAMAIGWGGLIAAIGLLIVAERDTLIRAVVIVAVFAFGGFLAGVRAGELRAVHGALAALAAYVFHAAFVVVGHLADLAGGPAAPEFVPGDTQDWFVTMGLGVLAGIVGATTAATWLRPQRQDRRRRIG